MIRVEQDEITDDGEALHYKGVELPPVESPIDLLQFAEWSVIPRYQREELGEPESVSAYSRRYNVPRRTLYNWKDQPQFKKIQNKLTEDTMGDLIHQVIRTAGDVATTKDVRAQKDRQMLLQMSGRLVDHKTVEHKGEVTVSHEEARRMKPDDMRQHLLNFYRQDERLKGMPEEKIEAFVDGLLGTAQMQSEKDTARALPSSSDEQVRNAQQRILELPTPPTTGE
jgi:hypothetical protein